MTADEMRRFRKRWGLSQVALAHDLGVSPSSIHNYEGLRQDTRNRAVPIPMPVALACEALGARYERLQASLAGQPDPEDVE